MTQTHVRRIPMPKREEIAQLPQVAQTILGMFEEGLDIRDYKDLARSFVDSVNGKSPVFGKAAIRYKNPRIVDPKNFYSSIGEYNPDRIPVETYEKMRLDPTIALATSLIELPILGQNFRIVCTDEKISAVVEVLLRQIYRKLIKSMLRAIQFGFAAGEKVYEKVKLKVEVVEEGGAKRTLHNRYTVRIKKVKFAHPKSVRIIRDEKTEEIKYVTQPAIHTSWETPKKVKISKCVWFTEDDEYGNFFGNARYTAAYQPWYWWAIVVQFMLRYLERRGSPGVVGKAPFGQSIDNDGQKANNLDIIMKAAAALGSNTAVSIPSSYDKNANKPLWELELIQDDQRGDMFITVLQMLNRLKLSALFVPDKVAVAEGSSTNATAESHVDVHLMSLESLIQVLEDAINQQVIPDLVSYNFPPTKQVPCSIKIERLNYSKRTLLRDVLIRMLMLSAGSIRDGVWPKNLPSIQKIADFLEVPIDESSKIFLNDIKSDGNDDDNDSNDNEPDDDASDDSKPDDDDDEPLGKEQKIKDRNKDAVPRKERTSRDRKSRERI